MSLNPSMVYWRLQDVYHREVDPAYDNDKPVKTKRDLELLDIYDDMQKAVFAIQSVAPVAFDSLHDVCKDIIRDYAKLLGKESELGLSSK